MIRQLSMYKNQSHRSVNVKLLNIFYWKIGRRINLAIRRVWLCSHTEHKSHCSYTKYVLCIC